MLPDNVNGNIGNIDNIENIESKDRLLSTQSFHKIKLNSLFIQIKNYNKSLRCYSIIYLRYN